jgi:hypothetical protein
LNGTHTNPAYGILHRYGVGNFTWYALATRIPGSYAVWRLARRLLGKAVY